MPAQPRVPSPIALKLLIQRQGALKRRLSNFVVEEYPDEIKRRVEEASKEEPEQAPSSIYASAIEDFIFDSKDYGPYWLIDDFLDEVQISDDDRKIVEHFKQEVFGVFASASWNGAILDAFGLLDMRGYLITANTSIGAIKKGFHDGCFCVTRLLPLPDTDIWLFSGLQQIFPPAAREAMLEAAESLALQLPHRTLRNPELREIALKQQQLTHDIFMEKAGGPFAIKATDELQTFIRAVFKAAQVATVSVDEDDKELPALPMNELIQGDGPIAIYSHPREGLMFNPSLVKFFEALRDPTPERTAIAAQFVDSMLENSSVSPSMLDMASEHYPEAFDTILAAWLDQPSASWADERAGILAEYKRWYNPDNALPTITPYTRPELLKREERWKNELAERGRLVTNTKRGGLSRSKKKRLGKKRRR